jgi:hypothetical protein
VAFVSVADVRAFAPSDLTDGQLQLLIDEADAAIVQRHGPHTTMTETFAGGMRVLTLSRPAASLTSVTEVWWGGSQTLVADSDYVVESPYTLRRSSTWGQVAVVYVPADSDLPRRLAIINLVKLALAFSGYQSSTVSGVVSETPLNYQQERERILAGVASRRMQFA